MKQRLFPVRPGLGAPRIILALMLAFLPFSAFTALLLFGVLWLLDPAGGPGVGYGVLLAALESAGVVHELGHWVGAGPGTRVQALVATPGLTVVRLRIAPDPPVGSLRRTTMLLGGALANLAVASVTLALYRDAPLRGWALWMLFFHLLTALGNILPYKAGWMGPSDGWLLFSSPRGLEPKA